MALERAIVNSGKSLIKSSGAIECNKSKDSPTWHKKIIDLFKKETSQTEGEKGL